MKLKSIEMQGFKSFPDRIKLDFGGGITAVVGPNGSGKSNISDAVRWVLGEQSTKMLRGAKMEDVIFGGTQSRSQQGFAYVALTIDNTSRLMPRDCDELIISRRLYRDGESEHRINNEQVRLKDIHELFMDTGLGRDGYSIIGQGKISDIVSAKSAQRREIFDEAAGISRYRYRKEQAEKQLNAAQENLLRLRDIVSELESRIEPLKEQSAKANKFIELEGEKRVLEISLWMESTQRLKEQLAKQDDKTALRRSEYERTQEELARVEERVQELYRETQRCNLRIEELRSDIKACEEQIAQADTQTAVHESDIRHNAQLIEELQGSVGGLEQDRESAEKKLRDTLERESAQAGRILELERGLEQLARELDGLREAAREDERSLGDLTAKRDAISESIAKERLELTASSTLIEEARSRLESMDKASSGEDEIQALKAELKSIEEAAESAAEERKSCENAGKGHELRRASQAAKENSLSQEQQALLSKAREHRDRAKLLHDMERSMEGLGQSVKHVISAAERGALRGIKGPVSRLIDTDEKYATAIETALGGALQNIVVEDEDSAKAAINALKSAKAGRATFLPLTSIREGRLSEKGIEDCGGFVGLASSLVRCEYANVASYLLGRIVVVEDIDDAIAMARKYSYKFRIVTLDGQLVNAGGSMTGGFTARSGGMLGRSAEMERLRAAASELEEKAAALDAGLKAARQALSAEDAALSGITARIKTLDEDKIRLDYEKKRVEKALADAVRAQQTAQEERLAVKKRLAELKERSSGSDEIMDNLNAMLEQAQSELDAMGAKRGEDARLEQELSQRISELKIELTGALKDGEQISAQAQSIRAALESQGERAAETRLRIERLTEENERIGEKKAQLASLKERLKEQAGLKEAGIKEQMRLRDECEQESQLARRGEKEISARREQISAELARFEEKKLALQSEYDVIITRLWDEYGITRSQALETAREIKDYNASQKRLSELKSKIKALGDVNVGAIEEYREVSQRYTTMKTQVEDVEKSRTELLGLIDSLTKQMEKLFVDNFRQINEHFGRIFVQLFGGGRAHLSLSDESDPLGSGIDISVQPPGKVIKSLSLLSGGEQAFIAIAIYFAILKVRPSPFCLLDEIEAALDDVNVTKFAQYLRSMCGRTQFIVITHRRGTMDEADVLYGVTMQEEGVSKLLRLNVSEIESKLGMGQSARKREMAGVTG